MVGRVVQEHNAVSYHVIPSQHNYRPHSIKTRYGIVVVQRYGPFHYTATDWISGELLGGIRVNSPYDATPTLYTATAQDDSTAYHRDTLEDCAEMLALHASEENQ